MVFLLSASGSRPGKQSRFFDRSRLNDPLYHGACFCFFLESTCSHHRPPYPKSDGEPYEYYQWSLASDGVRLQGNYRTSLYLFSQASLPDDTILEYIENGYDIQQIARAMCSDINLIALKVDTLIAQGYQLRKQEHQNDFLKYSKKI